MWRSGFVNALGVLLLVGLTENLARADAPAGVHPIFSRLADAPQNDLAIERFRTATRRFGLGPVEIVATDPEPLPRTAEKIRDGSTRVRGLDFAGGLATLNDAAAEVAASGGGGLDAAALSDLFLYRAWAIARADFNKEHVPEPTARAQAFSELLRAVMLTPNRALNPQQFPPVVLQDWGRAVAEAAARPQGTLLVQTAPEALVTCDGGAPISGPATFAGLTQGDHLIRIEEPGWAPWGATVSVNAPSVQLHVPQRRMLSLDDATAGAHARRMAAKFALVAEPRPGRDGGLSIALRLVDSNGVRRDAAVERIAGDAGAFDAAVMRLDEQARQLDATGTGAPIVPSVSVAPPDPSMPPPVLVAPNPTRARFADDPAAWSRDHWPLLTAIGVMAGAAIVLAITVAQ